MNTHSATLSTGLDPTFWNDAFLGFAIVGAVLAIGVAGALSGHLAELVAAPGAVARAAEAVIVPLGLCVVGLAGLWPADVPARMGIAVTMAAAGTLAVLLATLFLGHRGPGMPSRRLLRLAIALLATVPTIVGGYLLISNTVPGLDPMLLGVGWSAVGGPLLGALVLLDLPRSRPID
jgi:hypothetical protein